ncbi:MAG: Rho termination factor N-terminal domain-containing protein [Candidatus Izemoplasmatales bacterium]
MVKVSNAPKKAEKKAEPKKAEKKAEPKQETKKEEPKKETVKKQAKEQVKDSDQDLQEKLESHTVVELREMAKEHDLHNYSKLRKAELIELIKTAL